MEPKYNYKEAQENLKKYWQDQQLYAAKPHNKQSYTIDTPPPTVSGSLHIGHVFSYTQTDILARFARLSGFNVIYPFGFDDNGLATERFVEKIRDIRAHELPRSEFIAICLEETKKAQQEFKALWQDLALSVDWNLSYSTISPLAQKLSQQSFLELYEKGFVYRKAEPALYCTTCRTAVAQAELEDRQESAIFYTIAFKDSNNKELLIATTRPELLSSCVAIFYNPTDKRYQHLKGTQAYVPLFNNTIPILADDAVSIEKGTGLVMCCTFGDKTDIEWFKKYNLAYRQSIGLDGKWTNNTGFLAGMNRQQARTAVIEKLKEQGLVKDEKQITHTVNVHERCHKPIEYIILSQWFIRLIDQKQLFLDSAQKINWYPIFMKSRYDNWVENIGWDWCISRQRFYGIPFPAWHCTSCNHIILASKDMLPIDPQEKSYPGKQCPNCKSTDIKPDTDVMDTWNTSSITPYIISSLVYKDKDPFDSKNNFIPMSTRPQAHDIIRTWAFYTIVKAWMHNQKIPWENIVISGHVLSSEKEKLSKSKGNNPLAPENLLQQFSADAIRYWTASGRLGADVTFSDNQLKIGERLVTKLWNAFRFIQSHQHTVNDTIDKSHLGIINEWILSNLTICFNRYKTYFEQQEFSLALDVVEHFFWHDFCDNYLELIKHQLFNQELYDKKEIEATLWILHHTGLALLQLYAPYLPYITEQIYQEIYKKEDRPISIHLSLFSEIQKPFTYEQSASAMKQLISIIAEVRKIKTQTQLSLKTPLTNLTIVTQDEKLIEIIKNNNNLLQTITHASQIIISNKKQFQESFVSTPEGNSIEVVFT